MSQVKITLDEINLNFVSNYESYGYSSKSEIIAIALNELREKIEAQALIDSAKLYQELYDSDLELQELTNDAANLCLD